MSYAKTSRILKKHLQNYFTLYFILFSSFILGNILGSFVLKNLNYNTKVLIFTWFHPFLRIANNYSRFLIFKKIFIYNIFIWILILILGIFNLAYVFIPIIITLLGATVGFRVGFLVTYLRIKGLWLSIIGIYPQYVFYLMFFLGSGALSMSLSDNPFNRMNKNMKNMYKNKEYIILFLFFLIFCFLGVLVEVFCSPVLKIILNDII